VRSAFFFHLNDFRMLILLEEWVGLQVLYNYAGRKAAPEHGAISSSGRHVDSTGSALMHFAKFSNKD
jgi:hypothetical protein